MLLPLCRSVPPVCAVIEAARYSLILFLLSSQSDILYCTRRVCFDKQFQKSVTVNTTTCTPLHANNKYAFTKYGELWRVCRVSPVIMTLVDTGVSQLHSVDYKKASVSASWSVHRYSEPSFVRIHNAMFIVNSIRYSSNVWSVRPVYCGVRVIRRTADGNPCWTFSDDVLRVWNNGSRRDW